VEVTTGEDGVGVVTAVMVVQEDLAEINPAVKVTRGRERTLAGKKKTISENRRRVGREAEVAVDSVVRKRTLVVDVAIVIIVAEEGGGDHALTPKVKIRERKEVSKRSNGKVATASVVVVDPEDEAAGVADEAEGDSLVDFTAEGLLEDVLKVTVKGAMSKRVEKAVKIASPSPMKALRKHPV